MVTTEGSRERLSAWKAAWAGRCRLLKLLPARATPVALVEVSALREVAEAVVASFEADWGPALGGAEIRHIGATALPLGHTKGDVDVNVRVDEVDFAAVVGALSSRLAGAQRENWTPAFASFSTDEYPLSLGVQVTVIGSADDFLLALHERLRTDPALLRRYDALKLASAAGGPSAYWQAKDRFLRELRRL